MENLTPVYVAFAVTIAVVIVLFIKLNRTLSKYENEKLNEELDKELTEPEVKPLPWPATYRERLEHDHPELTGSGFGGGCKGCPHQYGYESKFSSETFCHNISTGEVPEKCTACWNRYPRRIEEKLNGKQS